jgi:hypothetical protein
MRDDPFNLDSLRIDPADAARLQQPRATAKSSKKWQKRFVRVPCGWVERLQSAERISTYRLALPLLYESWRTGGRPIVLSNVFAEAEGLSARSKWNALAELEALGLVRIERHPGRSPRLVLQCLT